MIKIGKIFNKERDKPLKRVELKASALKSKLKGRLSRTGGANAAFSPIRGITLNTKHGLRLSKTLLIIIEFQIRYNAMTVRVAFKINLKYLLPYFTKIFFPKIVPANPLIIIKKISKKYSE